MLISIGEHISGWVTWVIVSLLVLAFSLWGIQYYLGRGAGEKVLVKVNGFKITDTLFQAQYRRLRREQRIQAGEHFVMTTTLEKQLKQQAEDQLISTTLFTKAADKAGFVISPTQLNLNITHMPYFQEKGVFSPQRFSMVLNNILYTEQGFLAEVTTSLLTHQLKSGFVNSAFVLPSETLKDYALLNQQRDFDYAALPVTRFLPKVNVTEQAVKAYYEDHLADFHVPERVKLSYVTLSVKDIAKRLEPTAQAIKNYYAQNENRYNKPLEAVEPAVKQAVAEQMAQHKFADLSDQLANLTYADPNTLAKAAVGLHLTVQSTDWVNRDDAHNYLMHHANVAQAAFSPEVLLQGNNSDVINLDPDTAVVIRVLAHQKSAPKTLNLVKADIQLHLKEKAAIKLAQQTADKMVAAIQSGQSLPAVAKTFDVTWQKQAGVALHGDTAASDLIKAAFHLPLPTATTPSVGDTLLKDSVAVIRITHMTPGQVSAEDSAYKAFQDEMANANGDVDYQLYVKGLRDSAHVVKG